MGTFRELTEKRARWIVAFTALLFASSTVPVFAASAPQQPPPTKLPPINEAVDPSQLPQRPDLTRALARAEREQSQRHEELELPAAVHEREVSRHAYAGLSSPQAQQLLSAQFAAQLRALNGDPARALTDAKLDRALGESVATVTINERTLLMDTGGTPVRTWDGDGNLRKVDLNLHAVGGGWAPENPLIDLTIPDSATGPIEVGHSGLQVFPVGANAASHGRPFGEKDIFYPDAETDTDLLVSPISWGVELLDQLRSEDSPELLRFELRVPEGASLRSDGNGGAEVARDGSTLVDIPYPTAHDAQGTPVQVDLQIEGDSLVLRVAHREGDFAYPILVDPLLEEHDWFDWDWEGLEDGSWQNFGSPYIYASTRCIYACWGSGRGLYLSAPTSAEVGEYYPWEYGEWDYTAPGRTTYIPSIYPTPSVVLNPFWRSNHNCNWESYREPYDYDGLWDGSNWTWFETDRAQWYGNATIYSKAKTLAFGLGFNNYVYLPCWRDIMVAGVSIYLDDAEAPHLNSVEGLPTGWLKKDTTPRTVTVSATDEGLGVQYIRLFGSGSKEWLWNQPSCTGLWANRCQETRSGQITFTTDGFPFQGKVPITVQAVDPLGKGNNSQEYTLLLDGTAPTVKLTGQLARITAEEGEKEKPQTEGKDELSLPTYKLTIEAKDGSTSELRSGVKEIKIFLDNSTTPLASWTQTCPEGSCAMTRTYTLKLPGLSQGEHTLKIGVVDQAGNEVRPEERKIKFEYIPATGMKEEYVLQRIPLPDGHDYSEDAESQGPEIAVNVMNGNLVYHERDVNVEGARADLALERIYNSQLPTEKDTQWGHGWAVAQTSELKPQPLQPTKATMVRTGALTNAVTIPASESEQTFSPKLHATIGKTSNGNYQVVYANRDETSIFNASGRIEETRFTSEPFGSAGGAQPVIPSYTSSFGASGTGNGQFAHPAGIAIAPNGNLWIADESNHRLEKFTEAGVYLTSFGASGAGNGQFGRPTDVAIAASGNLWVTDANNNRIEEFNANGEFLKTVGSAGSGNGQFSGPEALAIDSHGDIWVGDTYNHRLQELNAAGEFIKTVSSYGTGQGQMIEPTGIAIGPGGNVWVADWGNQRVEEFSEAGTFIRQFGTEGTGNGQFKRPDVIDIDTKGDVWVGDQNNSRIQEFNQSGEYVTQFGTAGSGAGQFSFGWPMGIATDSKGHIWVSDTGNNRVQRWQIPNYVPSYSSSFGASGTGNGQFAHPAGIAVASNSSLWVVDENHYRVQKFSEAGEYLASFGSYGAGNSQFARPTDIVIAASGNLWVADAGNNRIKEFNPNGEFLKTVGSSGTGNGQFSGPEALAIDSHGDIWVGDTYNARLQEFSEEGEFIKTVSSYGTGQGQMIEPTGIAIDPDGNVWVADWGNQRVEEFSEAGTFIRQFGTEGTGNGQFKRPAVIEADSRGDIWVGDQNNSRIQEFNQSGEYVAQFGTAGTGQGQFSFSRSMGIATDPKGRIWISDTGNNRVQAFSHAFEPAQPTSVGVPALKYTYSGGYLSGVAVSDPGSANNPSLSVSLTSGLVSSVQGEAAGTTTYGYELGRLKTEKDPGGETKYGYDTSQRLNRIELPNGTLATIAYDGTSRATAVTVDPAGPEEAKTTHFWYGIEPRETKVWGGGNPEVIYSIGEDGSVFKWAYTESPPKIELSGSLWANRNSTTYIESKDQTLFVAASSPLEIAKVEILINGNSVATEEICEDNSEPPAHNCDRPPTLEWITNPASYPAGQLNLEVLATDFLGHSAAERFFVMIPQQPPRNPEAPEEPTFAQTKQFREEFGLDPDLTGNGAALNERVLNLLYQWDRQEPVAIASAEKWGIPLRKVDVEEMEYRENYLTADASSIPLWAEANAASTYAGYYVDNRQGGLVYVEFTANQTASVEALRASSSIEAPDRIRVAPIAPAYSLSDLTNIAQSLAENVNQNTVTQVSIDTEHDRLKAGARNTATAEGWISNHFGAGAPVAVFADTSSGFTAGRWTRTGPIVAGQRIGQYVNVEGKDGRDMQCTAGFGAYEYVGSKPNGDPKYAHFALTAGHCGEIGDIVGRWSNPEDFARPTRIGELVRDTIDHKVDYFATDAAAIRLDTGLAPPKTIYPNPGEPPIRVTGMTRPVSGMPVCSSGSTSNHVRHGQLLGTSMVFVPSESDVPHGPFYEAIAVMYVELGDSGEPIWRCGTGQAIGLGTWQSQNKTGITPLLPPEAPEHPDLSFPFHPDQAPGILHAKGMGELHLATEK